MLCGYNSTGVYKNAEFLYADFKTVKNFAISHPEKMKKDVE
jgi:hypothetical protein